MIGVLNSASGILKNRDSSDEEHQTADDEEHHNNANIRLPGGMIIAKMLKPFSRRHACESGVPAVAKNPL